VDSNEKIAGMANDIKQANDELEQQAKDIAKMPRTSGRFKPALMSFPARSGMFRLHSVSLNRRCDG
jgi:hypothetical protein